MSNYTDASTSSTEPPQTSIRFVFETIGDKIYLRSTHRVGTMAPSIGEPERLRPHQGYWLELRNRQDAVVYRCPIVDPLELDMEVFTEDSQRSLYRTKRTTSGSLFAMLVPDMIEARVVVIGGSTPDAKSMKVESRELLREEIVPSR